MLMNNLHTGSKDLRSFILDESPYTLIFKDEIERAEFEKKLETFNTPYPSNKEMRRVLDDLRHPIEDLSIDTDLDVESDLHKGLVLEDNLSLEELVDLGDVKIEEMEVGENNSSDNKAQLTRISDIEQTNTKASPKKEKTEKKIEEKTEANVAKKASKKKAFEGLLNPGDTTKRPKSFMKGRGNMGEEVGVDNNVGENQR